MPRSERCRKAKAMHKKNQLYKFYVRMSQLACNLAANGQLRTARRILQIAHELDKDAFWEMFRKSCQNFVVVQMLWPLVACLDGKEAALSLLQPFAQDVVIQGCLWIYAKGAGGEHTMRKEYVIWP